LLDKDEKILGINLLTMPSQFDKNWFPGKDYSMKVMILLIPINILGQQLA
jgi:hypothetical protein